MIFISMETLRQNGSLKENGLGLPAQNFRSNFQHTCSKNVLRGHLNDSEYFIEYK